MAPCALIEPSASSCSRPTPDCGGRSAMCFANPPRASPKAFLEAVEAGLEGDKPPIMSLFASDEGFLHPQEYLSDLLWSLESLGPKSGLSSAGRSRCLPNSTASIRAEKWETVRRDLCGRYFFRGRHRPTRRRSNVSRSSTGSLGGIQRLDGTCSWRLRRAITTHRSRRRIRTGATLPPTSAETITWGVLKKSAEEIGNSLLQHVGNDEQRWEALLGHWASFDSAWRQSAARQLTEFAGAMSDPANIESMRDTLRDLTQKHRNFSDADWAMPEADLESFGRRSCIAPADRAGRKRNIAGYSERTQIFCVLMCLGMNFNGSTWPQQRAAAEELLAVLSPKGLLDYATTVTLHHASGIAVASADVSTELKLRILEAAPQGRPSDAAADVRCMGLLISMASVEAEGWLNRLWEKAKQENWGDTAELRIVKALPHTPETWNRIAARSSSLDQAYWQTMPPPLSGAN